MRRVLNVMLAMLLAAAAARASPYWIEYEPANGHFPEEEGWWRLTGYGGDQRSIEDGWLVMDGTADPRIYDYALMEGGPVDPGPGELFVAQWRIRVDHVTGPYDPWVTVHSDEKWAAGFTLSENAILSVFEPDVTASFEPGIPHTFELQSANMRTYVLSIDGVPALSGAFWLSLTGPAVAWGDGVYGAASLARWNYFRFGVIPEPSPLLGLLIALCYGRSLKRLAAGKRARESFPNRGFRPAHVQRACAGGHGAASGT